MTVPVPRPQALRAEVDAAVAGLDGLDARPVGEHVDVFERVHAALTDALAERETGTGRGAGPA